MDPPKEFFVDGKQFQDWEETFNKVLDKTVQAKSLLLPDYKKNSTCYNDRK
jgi:hypothetical protein